jgi:hypothetical protein
MLEKTYKALKEVFETLDSANQEGYLKDRSSCEQMTEEDFEEIHKRMKNAVKLMEREEDAGTMRFWRWE